MKDLFGDDLIDTQQDLSGIDELFAMVRDFRRSERFRELLEFCARFPSLAPYNALMIHIQKPAARFVLPPAEWIRRYNRVPTADARPLVILWPFGPVQYWYDIDDTTPLPNKPDLFPEELAHPGDPDSQNAAEVPETETLSANLPLWGISLSRTRGGPAFSGKLELAKRSTPPLSISPSRGVPAVEHPARYLLSIRDGATPAEEFSAIARELGHFFCAHLRPVFPKPAWKERAVSPEAQEFEAETVAWLVCRRRGIRECRSYNYLSDYLGSHEEIPTVAIDEIMGAVRSVESLAERRRNVKDGFLFRFDPSFAEKVDRCDPRRPAMPELESDFSLPLWAPR